MASNLHCCPHLANGRGEAGDYRRRGYGRENNVSRIWNGRRVASSWHRVVEIQISGNRHIGSPHFDQSGEFCRTDERGRTNPCNSPDGNSHERNHGTRDKPAAAKGYPYGWPRSARAWCHAEKSSWGVDGRRGCYRTAYCYLLAGCTKAGNGHCTTNWAQYGS